MLLVGQKATVNVPEGGIWLAIVKLTMTAVTTTDETSDVCWVHSPGQYANNRAEISHQPTRQRERRKRPFTSAAHVQRFASVHGLVQHLFRVGSHLLRSAQHRMLRTRAFVEWENMTCAC
jgi:transposase-like protein